MAIILSIISYFEAHARDPVTLASVFLANVFWFNARYLILNGAIYYWGFIRHPERLAARSIHTVPRLRGQVRSEMRLGVLANIVFAAVGTACHYVIFSGLAPMYLDPRQLGLVWLPLSFLICLAAHDVYFYASHRMLHDVPWLYRRWHQKHHQFAVPTPFADLAMHPGEAALNGLFFPLILLALPMHPVVWGVFYLMTVLGNIAGHTGAELFPRRITHHPALSWITFMSFHTFHHSHVHGNFGFYTKIWDRLFGSILPAYTSWMARSSVDVNNSSINVKERVAS